jgi:hypothetical protein
VIEVARASTNNTVGLDGAAFALIFHSLRRWRDIAVSISQTYGTALGFAIFGRYGLEKQAFGRSASCKIVSVVEKSNSARTNTYIRIFLTMAGMLLVISKQTPGRYIHAVVSTYLKQPSTGHHDARLKRSTMTSAWLALARDHPSSRLKSTSSQQFIHIPHAFASPPSKVVYICWYSTLKTPLPVDSTLNGTPCSSSMLEEMARVRVGVGSFFKKTKNSGYMYN